MHVDGHSGVHAAAQRRRRREERAAPRARRQALSKQSNLPPTLQLRYSRLFTYLVKVSACGMLVDRNSKAIDAPLRWAVKSEEETIFFGVEKNSKS